MEKYYKGFAEDRSSINAMTLSYYVIFLLLNFITSLGCFNFMSDSVMNIFVGLYLIILYVITGINFIKTIIIVNSEIKISKLYTYITNLKVQSRYCLFNLILAVFCEDSILAILFLINLVLYIIFRDLIENKFIDILKKTIDEVIKQKSIASEMEIE